MTKSLNKHQIRKLHAKDDQMNKDAVQDFINNLKAERGISVVPEVEKDQSTPTKKRGGGTAAYAKNHKFLSRLVAEIGSADAGKYVGYSSGAVSRQLHDDRVRVSAERAAESWFLRAQMDNLILVIVPQEQFEAIEKLAGMTESKILGCGNAGLHMAAGIAPASEAARNSFETVVTLFGGRVV